MIDISNLRLEKSDEWTRLIADITSDFERSDHQSTIWFAVKNENAEMLTTDVYNAFLLYPLYMAMYYKSDLYLHGCVSQKLYNNVMIYLQPIMSSFSDDLKSVNILVDGFAEANGTHHLIGTGISGGVDCLSTIYTHFQMEHNENEKLNSLFMLNFACGGRDSRELYYKRCEDMSRIADALGLPFYEIDTNLSSFLDLGDRCSYFILYSCAFALERAIGKYYISSSFSYKEVLNWHANSRDRDWSEYADPYAIPLMRSENLELISDGCQYTRTEKTELISEWDIAQKYLYVCSAKESVKNCCVCIKCMRTLLPLEAMGKLDAFSQVFNLEAYQKQAFNNKCKVTYMRAREPFSADNYEFCKKKGMKMPSPTRAFFSLFPKRFPIFFRKRILRKK